MLLSETEYKDTYIFDLDGTLCSKESDYSLAKPFHKRISKVNKLYDQGNKIIIYTARGMHSMNANVRKCYDKYYNFTRNQLVDWGVKFDVLMLGKPTYQYWIDDKASNDEDFFKD